jgi:photosystem II stability/assembly factor-like uncharacterized protein
MRKVVLIITSFVLLINISKAQELTWKHTGGPMGGIIGDLAIDSNGNIYAGAYPFVNYYSGLYKSTDNGDTWEKIESQFEDFEVYSIYITKNGDIWVGTNFQGRIYLSTDDGETWENKRNGYDTGECWAFGQSNDGVMFAGDGQYNELYRSTDFGDNWELSAELSPLVFTTDSNNIIYAGTQIGLFATSDNGDHWAQNIFFAGTAISSILIDENNNLYCGTGYYDNGDGVWYSTDGGVNWSQLGLGGKVVLSLAFDSEKNLYVGTLKDGLYKTTDMGNTWYQYTEGIYNEQVFRLKINKQGDIFTGSENEGVYRSKYNTNYFEQVGLPISEVNNFVFSGDSLIFASTPSGVQKYNRSTKQWTNLGLRSVQALSITPSGYLYAAASPGAFTSSYDVGLFKSTDLGNTWEITNLTADTLLGVYNVLAVNDDTIFTATDKYLRRSFDGGSHWDILDAKTGYLARAMFINNRDLWVVTYAISNKNLNKSTDLGESFDSLFPGISATTVNNIIFATQNHVFLADPTLRKGIIRSKDNGQSWEQTLFRENILSVFADEEGLVIAGADSVYISSNYGDNWSGFTQPVMDVNYITDIKKDNSGKYFFGTTREGLYEVDIVTGVDEDNYSMPEDFMLYQNYPNPFNPTTTIRYQTPKAGIINLKVYDVLGKEVATLVDEYKPAGSYSIEFNGEGLASGIYIYQLRAGRIIKSNKMVLMK